MWLSRISCNHPPLGNHCKASRAFLIVRLETIREQSFPFVYDIVSYLNISEEGFCWQSSPKVEHTPVYICMKKEGAFCFEACSMDFNKKGVFFERESPWIYKKRGYCYNVLSMIVNLNFNHVILVVWKPCFTLQSLSPFQSPAWTSLFVFWLEQQQLCNKG